MKKLIIGIMLLSTGLIYAQSEDTTRFKIGGVEFIIVNHDTLAVKSQNDEKNDDDKIYRYSGDLTYWSGFDIGVNVLTNADMGTNFNSPHLEIDPAQSMSFSFNFMEQRIRIIKDYFGIVTGIGFTNNRYGFKDDRMRLVANIDSTWGFHDSTLTTGFAKNQLRVNSFHIPILFQINTSRIENKNLHIAFGVIGGVRMSSKVKYKYDVMGGQNDHKEKGRYNINPFSLAGTVRIGYRDFGLFANYNILSLYETNKSETAYPVTFGASFHF